MIPFPVPIWVCIHKYTIQSYTINIHTDINTPNFSTWQCAGRSRLSSLQMTNLLMISAHEGLRLPVRSFSFSPSLFFQLYRFNYFDGQLRYQYAAAAALIPETPHRFRGASWQFAQMHRKSRIEVLSLSERGHNTKSILPRMEMSNLTIWFGILDIYIYYIHFIYIYIYVILKSIIKPHFVFNVFHMTSLMFHHCFIIRAEVFELNGVAKGPQQGVGHLNRRFADRSRPSEVITLTYRSKKN